MIEGLQGLVRPLLTVMGFGAITWMTIMGTIDAGQYLGIVGTMLAFWFGERKERRRRQEEEERRPPAPPAQDPAATPDTTTSGR